MEKYNHDEKFKDTPEIDELEAEVEQIDAEIMRLVQRRAIVARMMAELRLAEGKPANPHSEELEQRTRWRNTELGAAIIRISRFSYVRYSSIREADQ